MVIETKAPLTTKEECNLWIPAAEALLDIHKDDVCGLSFTDFVI